MWWTNRGMRVTALASAPRRLVVFDLDGTLYDQRRLRRLMLRLLLTDALRRRCLTEIRVVHEFRQQREALASSRVHGFEPLLFVETARRTGVPETAVRRIVREWIDLRPLPHLANCVVPGTSGFFQRLRAAGVLIGVLSDYPAHEKLSAMGLAANAVVAATDPEVGVQKPDPRGLAHLLARVGCTPEEALMIGDREERDGAVAAALGMPFVLRSVRGSGSGAAVRDFTDPRLDALVFGSR